MSFQSLEGFVLNVMSWSVCIHLSSVSCSMSYSISLLSVWMCWRVSCVGYCDLSCLRSWIFCLICLLKVGLKFLIVPDGMCFLLAFCMMVLKCCIAESMLL